MLQSFSRSSREKTAPHRIIGFCCCSLLFFPPLVAKMAMKEAAVSEEGEEEMELPVGVTEERLTIALEVVEAVSCVSAEVFAKSVVLRPLRRALSTLVWRALERSGHERGDEAGSKEEARRAHRRKANREKQRRAAAERAETDRAGMRADRAKRLEVVRASNADAEVSKLMVPDGFTPEEETSAASLLLLEDDDDNDDDPFADAEKNNKVSSSSSSEKVVASPRKSPDHDDDVYAACYSCRSRFSDRHPFYGVSFCPLCASLNFRKRRQSCDFLREATAVVTGGRVKIGHCVALKLLRAGARVFVTSRFPVDTLKRFGEARDFLDFRDRLEVCGLDFRDLRAVEAFATYVDKKLENKGLDILINNACQTVRRPRGAYDELLEAEEKLSTIEALPRYFRGDMIVTTPKKDPGLVVLEEDLQERSALKKFFPVGCVDSSGQQLDARESNSWTMTLEDVPLGEAAECFAINALAPLCLCSRLKKTLKHKSCTGRPRFVVNVSAMEAKFHRLKTFYHPHTNMAKAALNMLTRTSAADYARDNIYMNCVDTGWVNDERPLRQASRIYQETHFQTPIDEIDAAARILDPVFSVLNGHQKPFFGEFLKDYRPTDW